MAERSPSHTLPEFSPAALLRHHPAVLWLVRLEDGQVLEASLQALQQQGHHELDLRPLQFQDFTEIELNVLQAAPQGQKWVQQHTLQGNLPTELTWQHFGNGTALVVARMRSTEQDLQERLDRQTWQMQKMASLPGLIQSDDSLDTIQQTITDLAREVIGAHQAVCSLTHNQGWEQTVSAVSFSEAYAHFREFTPPPTGKGIYTLVCESNQPARMTDAELKSHPRWRNFSEHAETHPPMRGWLGVPLIARNGSNLGLIQLSDKLEGDFTELDEMMLMQFAHLAASTIETSRLLQETRMMEKRMNEALQSAEVGFWEWDLSSGELFWDQQTADLMGVPLEQFNHRIEAFYEALLPEEIPTVAADIEQARIHHLPFEVAFRIHAPEGVRHLLSKGRFHYQPDGTAYRFTGILMNITERVQAVEQLQQSEKRLRELMERQKRFVADAAHELRTPLTAIQGNLDMFTRYPHIPEMEKKEILQDVQREATRLGRLVHDMLQLARGDSGATVREDEVQLHRIVQDAWRETERVVQEHQLDLGPIETIELIGDPDRLKQLTLILLENAVKYTQKGGTIRIALERRGDWAELRVSDNGSGISAEDLPRVFERFYRADQSRQRGEDPGGTGLGLPIAQWIVEHHHGQIWLESELGQGTDAVVHLPIQHQEN